MKYLHTMIRSSDLNATLQFFVTLGLEQVKRIDNDENRFSLIFVAAPNDTNCQIEITHNWDVENYSEGTNFGHISYRVDNIYEVCERLLSAGYTINRPPRDGYMAFVRTPDNISIELLQEGRLEPCEPWISMPNVGTW